MIGVVVLSLALVSPKPDSVLHVYGHTSEVRKVLQASLFASPAYGALPHEGLQLWADFLLSSCSVPLSFTTRFAQRKDVEAQKSTASDKLFDVNQAGYHLVSGLRFSTNPKKGMNFCIGIKQTRTAGLTFQRDLFNLIFLGNGVYEDQTAVFAPLTFSNITYNQFLVGASKVFGSEPHRISLQGEIGLTAGASFQNTDVYRGTLYTAPDGEYVDLDVGFSGQFSDTSTSSSTAINGTGIGLNITVTHTGTFDFAVCLQDLGFIKWNEQSLTLSADTAVHFEGFDANAFFDNPSHFFDDLEDTLRDMIGLNETVGSFKAGLPSRVTAAIGKDIAHGHAHIALGGSAYLADIMSTPPMVYVKGTYHADPAMNLSCTMMYGGFGGFDVGADVKKKFKKLSLAIGAPSLIGLVLAGKTTGLWMAASVSL